MRHITSNFYEYVGKLRGVEGTEEALEMFKTFVRLRGEHFKDNHENVLAARQFLSLYEQSVDSNQDGVVQDVGDPGPE